MKIDYTSPKVWGFALCFAAAYGVAKFWFPWHVFF